MADDPQPQDLQEIARQARDDEAAAAQLHGAVETLYEKVPDDPTVASTLADCAKFRALLRDLQRELGRAAAPAKLQPLVDDWRAARTRFHAMHRKHKDYLEKLALRIYR
jgi:hypothetical protein